VWEIGRPDNWVPEGSRTAKAVAKGSAFVPGTMADKCSLTIEGQLLGVSRQLATQAVGEVCLEKLQAHEHPPSRGTLRRDKPENTKNHGATPIGPAVRFCSVSLGFARFFMEGAGQTAFEKLIKSTKNGKNGLIRFFGRAFQIDRYMAAGAAAGHGPARRENRLTPLIAA